MTFPDHPPTQPPRSSADSSESARPLVPLPGHAERRARFFELIDRVVRETQERRDGTR